MGTYLNPGNSAFAEILDDQYIDKTGLITLINDSINTPRKLICISRPRRFGKSFAAQMLCAYYDKTCNSEELFNDKTISKGASYQKHLNQYDVIYVDMTYVKPFTNNYETLVLYLGEKITEELKAAYPELITSNELPTTMIRATEITGNKFIMIIDEWDAPIRENPAIQEEYLEYLRMLFKGSGTTNKIFAAAYMTGILPIKKDGSESAISDFWEYTMLEPGVYQKYIGFTEEEVRSLCKKNSLDFQEVRKWYDGYSFDHAAYIYNPYSVIRAVRMRKFKSYWRMSSAADALEDYIKSDYDGLFDAVMELLSGLSVQVDTEGFNNDIASIKNRDNLLTLLIHLGYLAYDEKQETGIALRNPYCVLCVSRILFQIRGAAVGGRICRYCVSPEAERKPACIINRIEMESVCKGSDCPDQRQAIYGSFSRLWRRDPVSWCEL